MDWIGWIILIAVILVLIELGIRGARIATKYVSGGDELIYFAAGYIVGVIVAGVAMLI